MKSIKDYFRLAIKYNASDIHLVGGEKAVLRINGKLKEIKGGKLDNDLLSKEIFKILAPEQKKKFLKNLELDLALEINNVRFRVNLHFQSKRIGLAGRLIPSHIPSPEDLNFEPILLELTDLLDGLVLVVGPTGNGKSTTLACLIEEINKKRKSHIITIEDPVEFIFDDKKSLIEQREVGVDTKSFQNALKYILRQDPNVILVGEMRDPETIATVLTAAETGHLVFSTLHTSSAAEAIERIIDVFEGSRQKQVLVQLSAVLRAVVAQQLVPAKEGGLIAVREILINTPAIANLIRENNIAQIYSTLQTSAKHGMITMEKALLNLYQQGLVSEEIVNNRLGDLKKI